MSFGDRRIRSGKFLKIESGEPVELRILDDTPYEKMIHGFGETQSECQGEHCGACQEGSEPKQRFMTNVFSHANSRVMVWEYGTPIHRQLVSIEGECEEADKSLKDVDLKIEKTGNNKTTKYQVTMKIAAKSIPQGLVLHKLDLPF